MIACVTLHQSFVARKPATAFWRPNLVSASAAHTNASPKRKTYEDLATRGAAILLSSALALQAAPPALAGVTFNELQSKSYMEVKGTGLAGECPIVVSSDALSDMPPGQYSMDRFCMEPTSFKIKETGMNGEPEFLPSTLLTRLTYTLDQMGGSMTIGAKGEMAITEDDQGMDYAAVTTKTRGGEEYPFLFSVKHLDAKGTADGMVGEFDVPAYRGSSFMDPKGRGGSTGYDSSIAFQATAGYASSDLDFERQNAKTAENRKGQAVFAVSQVDAVTGEVAGVFRTIQPVSDDQGNKEPTDVAVEGIWYAQLSV